MNNHCGCHCCCHCGGHHHEGMNMDQSHFEDRLRSMDKEELKMKKEKIEKKLLLVNKLLEEKK